jgi:hypothetical protein
VADPAIGRSRRGMTRRDLIKASAIAGAAAWTAPVIIDSLASPAAAQTGQPEIFRASVPCSWIYLIWTPDGGTTINYTGFKNGDTGSTCTKSANPGPITDCQSCPGTGISYQLGVGSPTPPMSYTKTEDDCPLSSPLQATNVQSCTGLFSLDGSGLITATGGVTILGSVGFTSNTFFYSCPNSVNPNNSLDAPAGCQEQ